MAKRLVNLFVKNVAAVERPANQRTFLVVKNEGDAMTFDEAMMGRRMYKVYMALSEQYGALMETLDSIQQSEETNKGGAIKTAMQAFLDSMTKAMPDMMNEMTEGDVEKSALSVAPLVVLRDRLTGFIQEVTMADELKKDEKKVPDASALTKIGQSIAAMFGRAMGATDETVAALEKAADPELKPSEMLATTQQALAKAATEATELKTRLEKAEQETAKLCEESELRKFAEEVSGFTDIGLDPAKDAALLKAVSEKLPVEQATRIREIFKSAVAQARASKLFAEVGSSGAGHVTGSASEEVDQKTGAVMAKAENAKLTSDQARDRVFRENSGLYERWARETTVRI